MTPISPGFWATPAGVSAGTATAAEVEAALFALTRADGETFRLHAAATAVARATDWQARAADAYRASAEAWLADIAGFAAELDGVLSELRAEYARMSASGGLDR